MEHGYWSFCSGGNCIVCNTPWPEKQPSILDKFLREKNYHTKFITIEDGRVVPYGMAGVEFIEMSIKLDLEYKKLLKKDPIEECIKRGAI